MTILPRAWATLALLALASCTSSISFQDLDYDVETAPIAERAVVVIPPESRATKVRVRSFLSGIANKWDAEAGLMLEQVAEFELPQLFESVEFDSDWDADSEEPAEGDVAPAPAARVDLILDEYEFEDFVAKIRVHAMAFDAEGGSVLDEQYAAEGKRQQGKMFWGGAFGMKSAIRQSSLAAYRKIFADLRADLGRAFGVWQPEAEQAE